MKKIILIGAGGHCVSCIDVIEMQRKFKIVGLIDNKKKNFLLNYKIVGSDKELKKISKRIQYALITAGHIKNSKIREHLFKKVLNYGFRFPAIISSLSYVSKHATIGAGTIVMHGSIINAGATIGKNCIINSKSLIEHDVVIEDHCHISTGAILNGGVMVKEGSFIGSRSTVMQNKIVGKNSIIPMGSIIKK